MFSQLECFAYRVRKYIGAYAAALGGVDTLVFTGGIGEHSASMRARICQGLSFLGLDIDDEHNQTATGQELAVISVGNDRRVWIVPTDEERQIAREAFALLHHQHVLKLVPRKHA
jgi:acetate kinase